jgi:hypothetical protein
VDTELVGHLRRKDIRPLKCSFPYQTLLVKGSISFKGGEEAKAISNGSSQLNENIKDLEKEAVCYFTDGSKICNPDFSCVTASEEIKILVSDYKVCISIYRRDNGCFGNLGDNSESQGEASCICSESRSVYVCLTERSLSKNAQNKTTDTEETQKGY